MSAGKRGEEETTYCIITVWNWNGSCVSKHCVEGKQSEISVDLGSWVCKPEALSLLQHLARYPSMLCAENLSMMNGWELYSPIISGAVALTVRRCFIKLNINELWCVWWRFGKKMLTLFLMILYNFLQTMLIFSSDHLRICKYWTCFVSSKRVSTKILTEGPESQCEFDISRVKQWKRAAEETVYRGVMLVLPWCWHDPRFSFEPAAIL